MYTIIPQVTNANDLKNGDQMPQAELWHDFSQRRPPFSNILNKTKYHLPSTYMAAALPESMYDRTIPPDTLLNKSVLGSRIVLK